MGKINRMLLFLLAASAPAFAMDWYSTNEQPAPPTSNEQPRQQPNNKRGWEQEKVERKKQRQLVAQAMQLQAPAPMQIEHPQSKQPFDSCTRQRLYPCHLYID